MGVGVGGMGGGVGALEGGVEGGGAVALVFCCHLGLGTYFSRRHCPA